MIISTTDKIPGREVVEIVGVAKGNTVRARNFGRDLVASIRNVLGGEIDEYTKLLDLSRDEALQRMSQHGKSMGADAIINVRMTTSMIVEGASEILAYGTAVKLR